MVVGDLFTNTNEIASLTLLLGLPEDGVILRGEFQNIQDFQTSNQNKIAPISKDTLNDQPWH